MDEDYLWFSRDDDEFVFVLFPEMFEESNDTSTDDSSTDDISVPRVPRRLHTSKLTGAAYVHEKLTGAVNPCRWVFGMEPNIFIALANTLRNRGLLKDGKKVTVELKLVIFLFSISTAASNRKLQVQFQLSGDTVSQCFGEVKDAITQLYPVYIRPPSLETHRTVLKQTKFSKYFGNCIGAIDGTHIPMTVPEEMQQPYRNRKQTLSQNVMVACDFDLLFVHVYAGWEGSASDARVLQHALDDGFEDLQ